MGCSKAQKDAGKWKNIQKAIKNQKRRAGGKRKK